MRTLLLVITTLIFIYPCYGRKKDKSNDLFNKGLPASYMPDTLFSASLSGGGDWWKGLNDKTLDSLVSMALNSNQNVIMAIDNILAARASLKSVQGLFYPSIDFSGGWNKIRDSRTTTDQTLPLSELISSYTSATVSASWEIDLFGRIRSEAKVARYKYLAEIDNYNTVIMSLTADMTTYYANLRTLQQQLIVAEKNIASQKAILDITEVRYNTGLASQLDVAQAKSVYFSTQSTIPVLSSSIRQQINAISVLAGKFPEQLFEWLSKPEKIPEYMQLVPVGIPNNILSKRPDISAAMQEVKAAEAEVTAAEAGFLPKVYLDGSFGFAAKETNQLFNNKSITYQISPKINWSLFKGLAIINTVKQSNAEYDAAARNYNNIVLSAMQDVDNAMAAYSNGIKQVVELRQVVVQGEITLKLSLDLYTRGLTNFQNVLDAQRSLLEYQNSLVSAQGNALVSLVALHLALGDGWQNVMPKK